MASLTEIKQPMRGYAVQDSYEKWQAAVRMVQRAREAWERAEQAADTTVAEYLGVRLLR